MPNEIAYLWAIPIGAAGLGDEKSCPPPGGVHSPEQVQFLKRASAAVRYSATETAADNHYTPVKMTVKKRTLLVFSNLD